MPIAHWIKRHRLQTLVGYEGAAILQTTTQFEFAWAGRFAL
jgi:hypothetical protein